DLYTLPVKDADIPALYKGDKKRLSQIAAATGAALIVAGTVNIPPTKNVGGPAEPLYEGRAEVRIRVWDAARNIALADVNMDLRGKGIFSELVYSLMTAAAEKASEQLRKDLGFPAPAAREKPAADQETEPPAPAEPAE
ncbi:MAG: hypothetical protein C4523_04735, partial [Myxococcales bacterium]